MRIVAFGRTKMLYNTIKLLKEHNHEIVLIGTCKASQESEICEHHFMELAQKYKVKFFNNVNINSTEITNMLKNSKADIAISINWLTIIKENVTNIFEHGVLNAHAGDLPRYRGNATPNWAIINNESRMGIAIHEMEPASLDSGKIYLKEYFDIQSNTTIGNIYDYLNVKIPEMYLQVIDGIENNTIVAKEQSQKKADILRCYPRIPSDSYIDWNRSAKYIYNTIRASSEPFSGAYTYYKNKKLKILKSYIKEFDTNVLTTPGQVIFINKENGEVGIATKNEILVLKEIEYDNNKPQHPSDIIKSMRVRLGVFVEDEIINLRNDVDKILALLEE